MPGSPFDLTGKQALITGSSRGLGLSMARGLAEAGAAVILNGTNTALLKQREAEFQQRGFTCHAYPFDVTSADQIDEAVSRIEAEAGPIDILVNNAGMTRRGALEDLSEDDWHAVIDLNLKAVWLVARRVVRPMLSRKSGKIINIASLMSFAARPSTAAYGASKAGVAMLTKYMAVEWTQHNVQTNAIAPGYFKTDLTAPLVANPEFNAWVELRTPAKRWGEPEELTGLLIFFASDASSFVTGQIVAVDGGWTANL